MTTIKLDVDKSHVQPASLLKEDHANALLTARTQYLAIAMLPGIDKPSLAAGGEIDRAIATFYPKSGQSETFTNEPDVKSPNQDSSNGPLSSSEEDVVDQKYQKHALIQPMKEGLAPTPIF